MKKAYLATLVTASLVLSACGGNTNTENKQEDAAEAVVLTTDNDKQTYAIGASMALFAKSRFEQQELVGMEVNKEALLAGFNEALDGASRFSDAELQQLAQQAEASLRTANQEYAAKKSQENIDKGAQFLAENATKEGVVVTESGLQYEVIEQGEGASPGATDKVKVHYEGTLLDGTVFDSSYKRGEPISFPLNGVIAGWTEGVQLMQEGSKYKFYIPSELAYGERGSGALITPNSTLIFVVELIEVNPEASE